MGKLLVFDHPLIQHKVSMMRDKNTTTKDFRQLAQEVVTLMTFEATRDLPLKEVEIETPICKGKFNMLAGEDIAVVPILRAGLGFLDGVLSLVPNAKVGFVGLYRDPDTHEPVEYYCKLPDDIDKRKVFVVDPMLATGGSASAAITMLKEHGCRHIRVMNILAAPEGVKRLQKDHPDVDIYIAGLDDHLNDHGYIVPGLGDAGDRIFGTK